MNCARAQAAVASRVSASAVGTLRAKDAKELRVMQIRARIEALGDESIWTHEKALDPLALRPFEEGSVVAAQASVDSPAGPLTQIKRAPSRSRISRSRARHLRGGVDRRRRARATDGSRASGRAAPFSSADVSSGCGCIWPMIVSLPLPVRALRAMRGGGKTPPRLMKARKPQRQVETGERGVASPATTRLVGMMTAPSRRERSTIAAHAPRALDFVGIENVGASTAGDHGGELPARG